MFEVPSMFRPPSMFGPPSMFSGVAQAASGVESAWCLSFDGSDDRVSSSLNLGTLIGGSTCTIACWLLPQGTSPTVPVYEAQVVGDTGQQIGICRTVSGGLDRIWAYNWDGSEDKIGTTYTTGEWVHVAMVHGSGQLSLYKNGALVGSIASGNTNPLPTYLGIGRTNTGNRTFNGRIDDVRIYSRALSSTEVTALYTNTSPPTDVAAYLPLEEGTGTSTAVKDSTGSTIATATLTNGPTWSSSVPPALA